jgi:peroxiredoxin
VRDNINTLQNDNTQVVGISVDSPFALDAWAAKEGYNFPLLSDFNKEVSTAYGSLYENLLGFRGIAKRSAFVVDKNGTVQYAWVSEDAHGQDETCPHLFFLGRSSFFQSFAAGLGWLQAAYGDASP